MNYAKGQATLKKYPAYKDSGVEWIGEIPVQFLLCFFCPFCVSFFLETHLNTLSHFWVHYREADLIKVGSKRCFCIIGYPFLDNINFISQKI